jgi:hypothetical protein
VISELLAKCDETNNKHEVRGGQRPPPTTLTPLDNNAYRSNLNLSFFLGEVCAAAITFIILFVEITEFLY